MLDASFTMQPSPPGPGAPPGLAFLILGVRKGLGKQGDLGL